MEPTKNLEEIQYNRAKFWQIAFFAMNNTATNVIIMAMSLISYYATGIVGLGVVLVSNVLTAMRIFDGFTDPLIGFLIDKTNGKFGKFRPYMLGGNVLMAFIMYLVFHYTHLLTQALKLPVFIVLYAIYILGYTAQTACTKSGQVCLTNDPKQRPLFGLIDGVLTTLLMAGFNIYLPTYLVPKYGNFTLELFNELVLTAIGLSFCLTLLAVIGIWKKDRKEFFGIGDKGVKTKFKDYWPIIKENRAIQMLVIAASTDKIGMNVSGNATVVLIIFALIVGNYGVSGQISAMTILTAILFIFFGTGIARKIGLKRTLVNFTWGSIFLKIPLILLFVFGVPTRIMQGFNLETVVFIICYILGYATMQVTNSTIIPMIADCADYETYRTGRFVPGMMGTVFSFVDKLISSFATSIVGLCVALVGFKDALPTVTDSLSTGLFWVGILLYFGIPMLGWIATLISMKFYPLDDKKMVEIQSEIARIKAEA